MTIVLLITTDNEKTIELPLLGECSLGRSSRCDLKVDDKQMSGKHGFFELNAKGEVIYTDLGSTNGSYLNNSQIQKIQFKVSETLRLGNTIITIDEKRLNNKERLTVGKGLTGNNDTIVMPASTKPEPSNKEKGERTNQKKSIIKDLKKSPPKSNWMGGKKENLIDQEQSSGETKMLKLDISKHKKK